MDADADGKVEMADVVEKVAAGTAQLSHRAQAARPEGAIALQLPMVFTLDQWLKEVRSTASLRRSAPRVATLWHAPLLVYASAAREQQHALSSLGSRSPSVRPSCLCAPPIRALLPLALSSRPRLLRACR